MALIDMSRTQPPTPAVTDSAKRDVFVNDNIRQRLSIAIDIIFYWVRYIVRQGKLLVYWMDGEHNLADYFSKKQPTRHHWAQWSIYLVTKVHTSKNACYMSPINLWGCVEFLPARGNRPRTYTVSLLHEKETDNRRTETKIPNRLQRYWRR